MNIYKHDVLNCGIRQTSANGFMNFICYQRTSRFELIILREALKKFGDYKITNVSFYDVELDISKNPVKFHTNLPVELFEEVKTKQGVFERGVKYYL